MPNPCQTQQRPAEYHGEPRNTDRRPRSVIPSPGPFLHRGGSRIRTWEGISQRIYNPATRAILGVGAYSETQSAHPSPPACALMTMARFRIGPSVDRLSGRNNAQQRDATLSNDSIPARKRGSRGWLQEACLVFQKILSIYVNEGGFGTTGPSAPLR